MKKGDRVRLTEYARQCNVHPMLKGEVYGTFMGYARGGSIRVLREGIVTIDYYHPDFWEAAAPQDDAEKQVFTIGVES